MCGGIHHEPPSCKLHNLQSAVFCCTEFVEAFRTTAVDAEQKFQLLTYTRTGCRASRFVAGPNADIERENVDSDVLRIDRLRCRVVIFNTDSITEAERP